MLIILCFRSSPPFPRKTHPSEVKTTSFEHYITHSPLSSSPASLFSGGMNDRVQNNLMLQQLYPQRQQQKHQQQYQQPSMHQSNGTRASNGTSNMFDTVRFLKISIYEKLIPKNIQKFCSFLKNANFAIPCAKISNARSLSLRRAFRISCITELRNNENQICRSD